MNKKVLSLVLALAIVLGSFGLVQATSTDVAYTTQDAKIQWLVDNGHVAGRLVNKDGSADLALKENVTRAEITKLLVHLLGKENLAEVLKGVMRPFPDVTIDHWANGYISVAATHELGKDNVNRLVIGYEDGMFKPENNVTYAELATMLVRIVKKDLTTKMEADSIWATSYMKWADEEGILEGLKIANSDAAATRADAFEMIYNAFFKMGSGNKVNFGDDLGIVSKLGNGEIQLNQDAKKVYKIDSNTMLTDGTTWKSLTANIDGVNRGSLVRLIVDKDGHVSYIIELGNPRLLALDRNDDQYAAGRWFGVAEKTAEGTAKFNVVQRKYVDIKLEDVTAEINSSTRVFVADVKNNALKEVESVADAFNLIGLDGTTANKVYMGYDVKKEAGKTWNEAQVIVFNEIDKYMGEEAIVRITGDLNSTYKFQAEDTKGAVKTYDVSNIPLFPTNDLLDKYDVVRITDNTNVQDRASLILIDASEDPIYKVVKAGERYITLRDKAGFQWTYELARDKKVFLEGQYKDNVFVQVHYADLNKSVIDVVSVYGNDYRGALDKGVYVGEETGYIYGPVVEKDGKYTVTIADKIDRGILVNSRTYEVASDWADEARTYQGEAGKLSTDKISFKVAEKFGETKYIYDIVKLTTQEEVELAEEVNAYVKLASALPNTDDIEEMTDLDKLIALRAEIESVIAEFDKLSEDTQKDPLALKWLRYSKAKLEAVDNRLAPPTAE